MTRTARSIVFLCGLALVLGGLTALASPALALASAALGALLIARSGVARPVLLGASIVLLGLAAQVLIVAAPSPVDWPMLGVAALAAVAAVALLRARGLPAGAPPVRRR